MEPQGITEAWILCLHNKMEDKKKVKLRIQNIFESWYFWKLKKQLDRDAISSLTRNSTTAKQIMRTFTPNDLEISTNKIFKSLNFSCGKLTAAK